MGNIIEYLQENKEKIRLALYFVLILVLAAPLSQMMANAWDQADIARDIVRLRLLVGADHQAISISVFGLYIGLLILMTIDIKKRWQAFLMWIGTAVALIALQSLGKFLPNVNLIGRFPLLLGGMGVGLLIGGGRKLAKVGDIQTFEFRWAARALYTLLVGFTVVSFIELHIIYPNLFYVTQEGIKLTPSSSLEFGLNQEKFIQDVIISGLFIVTTRQFVKYDAEKRFFILGPRASGKSLFLIGAYLEALRRTRKEKRSTPLNPSQDLMSIMEALDRQESEWIVEATGRGELKSLYFQYVHGSVFPVNIQISAYDYAGEYLHRIPDALTGAMEPEEMDNTLRRLTEGIQEADTLLLVIDLDRFVSNEPLDITEYFSVLQATTENKGVMIVATKADLLIEDFKDEVGLEPHLYFEDFQEYVTSRLRQNENVEALVQEAPTSEIHPIYYQTKVDDKGNRVPMRDAEGSVMTVGYDELLDKIGEL